LNKKVNIKDLIVEEKREIEEKDRLDIKKKVYKSNVNQSILTDERGIIGILAGVVSAIALIGGWVAQGTEIALASLLSIISILMKNPIMAYVFVIFFMFGDIALTGSVLPAGFVGTIISQVLSILGLNIIVTTPMLLIIIVITPLIIYAFAHSGK